MCVVENSQGMLEDDLVAVKRLYSCQVIEDKSFRREVDGLMDIRHPNIVWFIGYCSDTQEVFMPHEGGNLFVETRERLLCFEYLHKGSLHKYLSGMIVE